MSLVEGLLIFFAIIAIYAFSAFVLHKKGVLKKYNISFWGPVLMWRTNRGKKFLQKLARKKRFWKAYSSSGIVLCFIMMVLMTTMLIWQAWLVFGFTPEQKESLPGPEVALVIPGINPILPLEFIGYIILALVVAMVVHEFSHGILTFAGKLKVKSLGILYCIVPIGAFCEPDDEELKNTTIKTRMRVYAAGPTSNFVVVLLTILVLSFGFMSAVQPAADGVSVLFVSEDTAAADIGLSPGMIISSINNTAITNLQEYIEIMGVTQSNTPTEISYVQGEKKFTKEIILDDKSNITQNQSYLGQGYLGVRVSEAHKGFLSVLKNPFISFPDGFLLYYILPLWGYFQGYNPIIAPFTDSYIITGPLSIIPTNVFWIIVNALYWIFWLNLAVALFNVLPMVPLDGGFLFNDAIHSLVKRVKKDISDTQRDKIVKNISIILSLSVLLLIIFPWLIKYI